VRQAADAGQYDALLWHEIVDLGWPGIAVAEPYGGQGLGAVELAVLLEELGAGGMGKVYKGVLIGQSGFQRPIVMKQLRHSQDQGHLRLFVDEARRYAVLDHENIGRIFDFENVDDKLCIILEYIDGWSLVEYLEQALGAADGGRTASTARRTRAIVPGA